MKEVVMPAIGVAMSEGLLIEWLQPQGGMVQEGEPIAEIETDKTTMELSSPCTGWLGRHRYAAGDIAPVGAILTVILESVSEIDPSERVESPQASVAEAVLVAPGPDPVPAGLETGRERKPHVASPRQRRLARETESATPTSSSDSEVGFSRSNRRRALIADRVTESWHTIPHFAVSLEVDAESMVAACARARAEGVDLSPTDLMLRALAVAIASAEGTPDVDLGLAVATDDGVVIPVIRRVLNLDDGDLARERHEAVDRARSSRLTQTDLSVVPLSTLSNLGSLGVDQFTGVIAMGQRSLLTAGRISPRPVAAGGHVVVRQTFFATLNVDHRLMDGQHGAEILNDFADAIQTGARFVQREDGT